MLASLRPEGRAGIVVPHGILFRGGTEQSIRRGLVEDDVIEAIVALPPNLFYGTTVSACLLFLNRRKGQKRRDHVLFVDGAREFERQKSQCFLSDANVKCLANAFHSYRDEDGFTRVVDLEEIRRNDHCLSVSRYVQKPETLEIFDAATEVRSLLELKEKRTRAESKMLDLLGELGLAE